LGKKNKDWVGGLKVFEGKLQTKGEGMPEGPTSTGKEKRSDKRGTEIR